MHLCIVRNSELLRPATTPNTRRSTDEDTMPGTSLTSRSFYDRAISSFEVPKVNMANRTFLQYSNAETMHMTELSASCGVAAEDPFLNVCLLFCLMCMSQPNDFPQADTGFWRAPASPCSHAPSPTACPVKCMRGHGEWFLIDEETAALPRFALQSKRELFKRVQVAHAPRRRITRPATLHAPRHSRRRGLTALPFAP
jgi:hypothetical protein